MGARFKIGEVVVGDGARPFIIAEAGINHNGDIELAKKMIEKAAQSGADAVKFQTFHTEDFITDRTVTYAYRSQGKVVEESMFDMFARTEFTDEEWRQIKAHCDACGITFLSTPVTERNLDLLIGLGVGAIKIGSDDFTNLPLIEAFSKRGLPLLLSCGMADEGEMEEALRTASAQCENVCLFLCTSQYPTPPEDVNARKLLAMKKRFPGVVLGFSDHTQGCNAAIVATAYGAKVFEKHFTLSHDLPGPDHWFASEPDELAQWVAGIREADLMLGSQSLMPTAEELEMRHLARRSIVALTAIEPGDLLDEGNVGLRRPGTGLAPRFLPQVLGKRASRSIAEGAQIAFDDIREG